MGLGGNSGIDFEMWASKGLTISQQYDFVEAWNHLKKARTLLESGASYLLLKLLNDCITEIELEGNIEDDATREQRKKEYADLLNNS
jgi:hypothetical protein